MSITCRVRHIALGGGL